MISFTSSCLVDTSIHQELEEYTAVLLLQQQHCCCCTAVTRLTFRITRSLLLYIPDGICYRCTAAVTSLDHNSFVSACSAPCPAVPSTAVQQSVLLQQTYYRDLTLLRRRRVLLYCCRMYHTYIGVYRMFVPQTKSVVGGGNVGFGVGVGVVNSKQQCYCCRRNELHHSSINAWDPATDQWKNRLSL